MRNSMELEMKKILDSKAMTFGVWGLKTSLGQFWPEEFIKPKVQNRSSNFHKQDLIFSRIQR